MYQNIHSPFRCLFLSLLFSLFLNFSGLAQEDRIRAHASMAEKIYLQLDAGVYTNDQTIWFKAIVASAVNHVPGNLSGVLYVELIDPDERIVEKKLVKITKGIGDSFFQLNRNHREGRYMLRAYTEWNRNFDRDFVYTTYVDIFPATATETSEAITAIELTENDAEEFSLTALLDPQLIDSLHQDRLQVYLNFDGQKDTLTVRRNSAGNYLLEYPVSADIDVATLGIETENDYRYSKTITLNPELLDVQFFPESGEIVHGLVNRIGFKVLDHKSRGLPVEGEILDADGKKVTTFKSNKLGMGSFFIKADSSTTYHARLTSHPKNETSTHYSMPEVRPEGNMLSVTQRGGNINLISSSNYMESDSIFVEVTSRGVSYYTIKGKLQRGQLVSPIPAAGLPEGIIAFTLLDSNKQPIAERLFFNEQPENRLAMKIATDKENYEQREKTTLDIQVTDGEGQPAKANLSVLVFNKEMLGETNQEANNILSYFLLDSELRGKIEDPCHYFREENEDRLKDLDALMLTQGWRKYNYSQPPRDTVEFQPEPTLNVTGTVGGVFFQNNKKEGIELTMMTFGESKAMATQTTDSLGQFYFPMPEEYGERLNILIQSANKSGNNRNYNISLDEQTSPPVSFDQRELLRSSDQAVGNFVEKQQERKLREESFEITSGVTELDEVLLDGYNLTPQRKKVMEAYGKPDTVIDGKDIQEKEQSWSYGLYSVLLNYSDDIRMKRIVGEGGGYMEAEVVGGDETIILIDGLPVREYDLKLVQNIPPSEVKSVEVLKFVANFRELYRDVYPDATFGEIPITGSIIAIYTDAGEGLLGTNPPVGVLQTSVPVFSPQREFYAPKYESLAATDREKPDLRSTIHWEPRVEIDSTGISSITFFNADGTGEMMVVIEAISENGEVGYEELTYEVRQVAEEE